MKRVLLTLCVLAVWVVASGVVNTGALLITGETAGAQFQPSDLSYLTTMATFKGTAWLSWFVTMFALAALYFIWVKPLKTKTKYTVSVLALLAFLPVQSKAYYDKTDYTEAYFILTNESAFFIPDVGDNKTGQAAFGSLAYYEQNKIAAKRFVIPHTKLDNSGLWSNYYVPAGRLIVVDRTPQSREWVKSTTRGTSHGDQSFPCQSKEGLDITTGIAIGVSVEEANAPKFLYKFGVTNPGGDRHQPEVIFQSVFNGKSLAAVTDGPVRNKVQSAVCDELTTKTLDEANEQAAQLMKNIEAKTKAYLAEYGITLDYIGWADTFEFGKDVQSAIDRKYVANKEAAIATQMAPHVATLQNLATAQATRLFAEKFDGKLPTTMLGMPDFSSLLSSFSAKTK
jgi:hypothetical protein